MTEQRRTALVTGGARRIGRAIGLALAEADYDLILLHSGTSPADAEEVANQARELGAAVEVMTADLREASAPRTVFESLDTQVDVLVNNAASFVPTAFDDVTLSAWDEEMALNLRAPFFLCQEFARQLPSGRSGSVINIGDARVSRPGSDHPVYRLTKSALSTMTRDLAATLAPQVRVNEIALGAILPPPGAKDDHFERMKDRIPLRRTGDLTTVTETVLFLLSAEFVTGTTVPLDGGEYL